MKKSCLLGAVCACIYAILFAIPVSAANNPIDSMNITGGTVIWSIPGSEPEVIPFTIIGANTNLVGGYIGVGGSESNQFDPPNPDNLLIFPILGGPISQNFAQTYTAASNLDGPFPPAGSIPGGPVPYGTLDDTFNTIEMDLSSWFGNLNNAPDIWGGTGLNDGFTSPLATGTWDPDTHEYELTWNSRVPEPTPFPGLESTWTLTGLAYPVISITIDIKPGSDPNCFNINGHGVIPVAILGTEDFDVNEIDLASLSFGGLEVRVRGNKGSLCSLDYSNEDAYFDLVCHFEDDSSAWETGDGEATLTGVLFDGTSFKGTDTICVVP
jgi:hypothetical protein